jgi:hypothetical protein
MHRVALRGLALCGNFARDLSLCLRNLRQAVALRCLKLPCPPLQDLLLTWRAHQRQRVVVALVVVDLHPALRPCTLPVHAAGGCSTCCSGSSAPPLWVLLRVRVALLRACVALQLQPAECEAATARVP